MQFLNLYHGIIGSLAHRFSVVNPTCQSLCYMSQFGQYSRYGKATDVSGAY